jgi:hypothetical protein
MKVPPSEYYIPDTVSEFDVYIRGSNRSVICAYSLVNGSRSKLSFSWLEYKYGVKGDP